MSPSAFLSLLSRVNGLDSIEHQVLQLQWFHQVCVPHNAWRGRGGRKNNLKIDRQIISPFKTCKKLYTRAKKTCAIPLSKVFISSIVWYTASILSHPSLRTEPVRNTAAWFCMVWEQRQRKRGLLLFGADNFLQLNIRLKTGLFFSRQCLFSLTMH